MAGQIEAGRNECGAHGGLTPPHLLDPFTGERQPLHAPMGSVSGPEQTRRQADRDAFEKEVMTRKTVATPLHDIHSMLKWNTVTHRALTTEQFAYWVKGLADSGAPTTLAMLDAILSHARSIK